MKTEKLSITLSTIGIVLSIIALYLSYESNRGEILASQLPARTHVDCSHSSKTWFMVAYVTFAFYNRGGRGSSIVKIEASSLTDPITATTWNTNSYKPLQWPYIYVDESIGKEPQSIEFLIWNDDNKNLRLIYPNTQTGFSQSPILFNIQIPSGETKLVTFVFRTNLFLENSNLSDVHSELVATLSDGQKLPLQISFHAPSIGRGRCD